MNESFAPIYDKNCKVLILGSFPGVKSRDAGFYYGNKNNRFWRMLGTVYHTETPKTIKEKTELLLQHHIALWDIVKSCDIIGSKDEHIKNLNDEQINDIEGLLKKTNIFKILCNGTKSFELIKKFVKINIEIVCLPSTSSANTRFDIQKWAEQLGV